MGDNKAILRPPAITAGFASPVASRTSNAPIKPRKADKKPRDIPNVPLSLTNDIIFLDSSGLVLIL